MGAVSMLASRAGGRSPRERLPREEAGVRGWPRLSVRVVRQAGGSRSGYRSGRVLSNSASSHGRMLAQTHWAARPCPPLTAGEGREFVLRDFLRSSVFFEHFSTRAIMSRVTY